MEVLEKIIDWVRSGKDELNQEIEITGDTELLRSGLIDSLDLLQLVAYIEEEFDLKLPPEALTPDNFSTPESVSTLVGQILAHSP